MRIQDHSGTCSVCVCVITSKSMLQERKSYVLRELTKVLNKICDHLISGQDLFLGCGLCQVEGNLHLLASVFP